MEEIRKHIISADGTRIGYRQMGNGDGVIIVHGTGRISQNYQRLARALAESFTVYSYDRRGRGLSGPVTKDHSMHKEIEDLAALVSATKAKFIFGHSFGGAIALRAATHCKIEKLAVYEPAISINNSIPADWLPGFEKAIAENRKVKAMSIFLKALPAPEIEKFPAWALRLLARAIQFMERKKAHDARMLNLLYTIPADVKIVKQVEPETDDYKKIDVPVLLMSGTKSQLFFREPVAWLERIIPGSQIRTMDGFDHYSPEEKAKEFAVLLAEFFKKLP